MITYYGASGLTLSIIAITLSKISFGVTLLKLTDGWTRYYVYFAIANLAIFAIPVAIIPWVLCKPITKTFVDIIPGTCVDKTPSVQYARFQAGKSLTAIWDSSANDTQYGQQSWTYLLLSFRGKSCGICRCACRRRSVSASPCLLAYCERP